MAKKKKKAIRERSRSEDVSQPMAPRGKKEARTDDRYQFILGILTIGMSVSSPMVAEGAAEQFSNWIPFLLWVVLGIVVSGFGLLTKKSGLVCNRVDVCVYLLCGWIVLSGLVSLATGGGHARPTINTTFQWFGYAVAFFVIRQFSARPSFRRTAILAMLSITIGCSVAAVYQRYVILPEVWGAYEQQTETERQETLRRSGLTNVESGSREREMWERRLYATEPTATFVLTNSLAAFLTPWFVVLIGLSLRSVSRKSLAQSGYLIAGVLVVMFALLLTKSRTSYVAAGLGAVAIFVGCGASIGIRPNAKMLVILIVLIALIAGTAFMVGAVDVQVVSESFKSLSYRLEYWQASLMMIRDDWLFGCGPGNFQHSYARYQLVEASETVSDPHNFLIEIWAIAGTPALLLVLASSCFWFIAARRNIGRQENSSLERSDGPSGLKNEGKIDSSGDLRKPEFNWLEQLQVPIAVIVGSAIGIYVALLNDLNLGLCAIASLVAIICSLGWMNVKEGFLERSVLPIVVCTFFLGLCASGGIGFPSVAISGVLLVAISLGEFRTSKDVVAAEGTTSPSIPVPADGIPGRYSSYAYGGILVLMLTAALGFRITVMDPIRIARENAAVAEMEMRNGNIAGAMTRLDAAIKADPHDGNYLFFKLQLLFRLFQERPEKRLLEVMESVARKSATVRPINSKVTLETGKIFLSILLNQKQMDQNMKERVSELVREYFRMATDRRPNDALHAAFHAFALATVGDTELARQWAVKALEMDERNPHADKNLKNVPFRLPDFESGLDIEQELLKIRNK